MIRRLSAFADVGPTGSASRLPTNLQSNDTQFQQTGFFQTHGSNPTKTAAVEFELLPPPVPPEYKDPADVSHADIKLPAPRSETPVPPRPSPDLDKSEPSKSANGQSEQSNPSDEEPTDGSHSEVPRPEQPKPEVELPRNPAKDDPEDTAPNDRRSLGDWPNDLDDGDDGDDDYSDSEDCGCPECSGYPPCCGPVGCIKTNLIAFLATDGWANRGDDDHSNNFGARGGINSGWSIDCLPCRLQLGGAFGAFDLRGRDSADGNAMNTEDIQQQTFVTVGFYKRSCICVDRNLSWGLVYDHLFDDRWGERAESISVGQIRGQLGYALGAFDEVGARGSYAAKDDGFLLNGITIPVTVVDQLQAYWKHNWESGAETLVAFVSAQEPGQYGLAAEARVPLNARLAIYGEGYYLSPSASAGDDQPNGFANSYAEEAWSVSFGLIFYPGWKAYNPTISGYAGLPLLPVANNGSLISVIPNADL